MTLNKSNKIAIIIAVVASIWIISGQFSDDDVTSVPTSPETAEAKLPSVRALKSTAQSRSETLTLHGQSQASRSLDVKSRLDANVDEILVPRGTKVSKGTVLMGLSDDGRQQVIRQAKAQLNLREIEYEAAKKLASQGYNSKVRLAEAQYLLSQALESVKVAELRNGWRFIKAPYDGIWDDYFVEPGASIRSGDVIGRFVALDPIRITAQASEQYGTSLKLGAPAQVRLSDGHVFDAKVSYIGSEADETTRTLPVYVELDNPDGDILAGITAQITMKLRERPAHLIPSSALTLDSAGRIGVKLVDPKNKVIFHPIGILSDGAEGMWVSELPEQANIIVLGQDYVIDGQEVKVTYITAKSAASAVSIPVSPPEIEK